MDTLDAFRQNVLIMISIPNSMCSIHHSIAFFFQNLMTAWSVCDWGKSYPQESRKKKKKTALISFQFMYIVSSLLPSPVTPPSKFVSHECTRLHG